MKSLFKKVILLGFSIILITCVKNNFNQKNTLVPKVAVNTSVNANFISLVGQFTIKSGHGSQAKGIIVFNIDGTNFRAFDLACPYIKASKCSVPMTVDEGTGEMSCAGCVKDDIKFTQYKTTATIGGTKYALREYAAYREGDIVRITNF